MIRKIGPLFFSSARSLIILTLSLAVGTFTASAEAPICTSTEHFVPLKSTEAGAGTWANLRNHQGSLRFESSALFQTALAGLSKQSPPSNLCAPGCTPKAVIRFTSVPKKFLADYSEKPKCERRESETKIRPLLYTGLSFDSIDAFNSWYSDFSQGKGKEGEDLYTKCDGSCSPQYSTILKKDGDKIRADASVVCGPARDKDDNLYRLEVGYLWSCVES